MLKFEIKRGCSFTLLCQATTANGQPVMLDTVSIKSQVRQVEKLVANLDVSVTDIAAGRFMLTAPGDGTTSTWPAGVLECDIVYEGSPVANQRQVVATETFQIVMLKRVTA